MQFDVDDNTMASGSRIDDGGVPVLAEGREAATSTGVWHN